MFGKKKWEIVLTAPRMPVWRSMKGENKDGKTLRWVTLSNIRATTVWELTPPILLLHNTPFRLPFSFSTTPHSASHSPSPQHPIPPSLSPVPVLSGEGRGNTLSSEIMTFIHYCHTGASLLSDNEYLRGSFARLIIHSESMTKCNTVYFSFIIPSESILSWTCHLSPLTLSKFINCIQWKIFEICTKAV